MILVNEQDEPIGTLAKTPTHEQGLLHRAFSIFLFNDAGEMLLQKRALTKYHSAGLWTNACCSHPYPSELINEAALRRLKEELGIETSLTHAFSFIYKANFDNGLTEHEFDHVLIGKWNGYCNFNEEEVDSIVFVAIDDLERDVTNHPYKYTEWFKIALPKIKNFINN